MGRSKFFGAMLCLFLSSSAIGQNKAIVVQNVWNNDLNSYNPKDFFDKVFTTLKDKLAVRDFVTDPKSVVTYGIDNNWEKTAKEQIKARKQPGENAFYIALSSDLRLPVINLGKFLFKNPPRSSKLTFTIHVYDTSGSQILGDTIINRGCLVKTVDPEKGNKSFYSDYNNFMADMLCHAEAIRKVLQEKQLPKKTRYMEAK